MGAAMSDLPQSLSSVTEREQRTGAYLLQTAKSLGWPDDGEGALEFMLRRTREVAFEDCAGHAPREREPILVAALKSTTISLKAAVSLLEKTPEAKAHAASDKMFEQMMADYKLSIHEGRAALSDTSTGQKSEDPSRDELIESIQYAIGTLSMHIDAYHDGDYEPHQVPDELEELRRLQHHLEGSLIDSNGVAVSVTYPDREGK